MKEVEDLLAALEENGLRDPSDVPVLFLKKQLTTLLYEHGPDWFNFTGLEFRCVNPGGKYVDRAGDYFIRAIRKNKNGFSLNFFSNHSDQEARLASEQGVKEVHLKAKLAAEAIEKEFSLPTKTEIKILIILEKLGTAAASKIAEESDGTFSTASIGKLLRSLEDKKFIGQPTSLSVTSRREARKIYYSLTNKAVVFLNWFRKMQEMATGRNVATGKPSVEPTPATAPSQQPPLFKTRPPSAVETKILLILERLGRSSAPRISRESNGEISKQSIYVQLKRLEAKGFVKREDTRVGIEDMSWPRSFYSLTDEAKNFLSGVNKMHNAVLGSLA